MTPCWVLLVTAVMVISDAAGQDANFGLKVKCFVKDGTVLCPGCNSRAGMSCPRNRKMENCNIKTEAPFPEKENNQTETYEDGAETTTQGKDIEPSNTTDATNIKRDTPILVQQEEIDWVELAKDLEFRLFIYRILSPVQRHRRKMRELPIEEVDDTCDSNADCPCPLICCKTGEGCPKRCMSGIRLPPPWG